MVLVLPMYSSANNLNIENGVNNDLLNINGKRYNRNSSKTIWSYNPEDVLTKKFNTKWRPNTSTPTKSPAPVTNNFISASFNCNKLIDEYHARAYSSLKKENVKINLQPKILNEDEPSFEDSVLNESGTLVQQSLLSPRMSMSRKASSSSSSSSDRKSKLQANIVTTITQTDNMNKFVENNTSASRRIRMQQLQQQLQEEQKKEQKEAMRQKLTSFKLDRQNASLREGNVSRPSSKIAKLNADIKKMIDDLNNDDDQPVVYGKHIDNLTTELFVALSNGIDKNVIMKRTQSSFKEKSSSSSNRTSSTNLNELIDADQEVIETQEDNFVLKICNEIKNFQLAKNESDEDLNKNTKTKAVKIVEDPEFLKRPGKNIVPDNFHSLNKLLTTGQLPEERDMTIFPSTYFDPKFNENDFNYKYKKVLSEPFSSLIEQYDGNLPVEVVLKQSLPLNDYYSSLTANTGNNNASRNERSSSSLAKDHSENPRKSSARPKSSRVNKKVDDGSDTVYVNKDYEMYNILKRMMVKKKYEAATIKLEKANLIDKRKRRCQSSLSMIPNASAPNLGTLNNNLNSNSNGNIKIKMRPTTSFSLTPTASSNNVNSLVNSTILSKPFTEDDNEEDENIDKTDEFLVGEEIIRCAKCKKRLNLKQDKSTNENNKNDIYEEFRISDETIEKRQWPYELDSKQIINDQENNESNNRPKLYKCYTCTNLPANDANFISKSESFINCEKQPTKNQKYVNITGSPSPRIKSEKCTDEQQQQQQYQSQTYNSARRTLSAKSVKLVNQELTDHADKVEFQKLTCSHPRKMTPKEFIQYQRSKYLLPGKTFNSQRRQSISINRMPLSKIRADYEKENPISHLYPLVRFSTSTQELQQQQQEESSVEENRQENQNTNVNLNKTTNFEKARESVALKNFKIDPFIPSPTPKFKLYHNEQFDQTIESRDPNNVLTAFQMYKKTSKLIRKRPKTAK